MSTAGAVQDRLWQQTCLELADMLQMAVDRVKFVVEGHIADLNALDRWEDDGGPCRD